MCPQFLYFMAFFPLFMFLTTFFGVTLNGGKADTNPGDPGYTQYDEGQRAGNMALTGMNLLALVYSMLLQRILSPDMVKPLLTFSSVVMAVALLALSFAETLEMGYAMVIPMGITWATSIVLPWCHRTCAHTPSTPPPKYDALPLNRVEYVPTCVCMMCSPFRYIVQLACAGAPNAGVYNGIFNSSQCFPEILIAVLGSVLLPLSDNDYGVLFMVGGA